MNDIIEQIKSLPHFRDFPCTTCNTSIRVHTLQLYAICPQCGTRHKCRGYAAIGSEIEDVIDAVLEWAGQGETFEAVLERQRQIMADQE